MDDDHAVSAVEIRAEITRLERAGAPAWRINILRRLIAVCPLYVSE